MPTPPPRTPLAPLLAIALVALAVVPAMPAGAFHGASGELIGAFVGEGNTAFTLRIDVFREGPDCAADLCGMYALDLYGYGPATGPAVSEGHFMFTPDQAMEGGLATIVQTSEDRQVVLLPTLQSFEVDPSAAAPAAPPVTARTVHAPAEDEQLLAIGYVTWVKPGTYYIKVWMAGVTRWTLEVRSDDAKIVGVERGTSYILGDEDLIQGDLNVQAQRTIGPLTVGAKAMRNAYVDIEAQHSLVGFWGRSISSMYCQFTLFVCLLNSDVPNTASPQISYDSPSGTHSGNPYWYTLDDGAGDYRFRVDRKLNAWGPPLYVPGADLFAYAAEDMSYLTAADVAFP